MAEDEEAPADPPPPPDRDGGDGGVDAVTRALLKASKLLLAVSARSLAAVEDPVTLPQFKLLVVLAAHGDAKLVTLAERLGVNPSTAMRMLDRLIAAGLAERQTNPGNRRETALRVTPGGRRLVHDVTAARHREIAAIVARLAPEQRTALVAALTAFIEAGGEPSVAGEGEGALPPGWTTEPDSRTPRTDAGA